MPKSDLPLNVQDELRQLHEENARLKALLAQHGIAWEGPITSDLAALPQELAPVPSPYNKHPTLHPREYLPGFVIQQVMGILNEPFAK